MQARSYLLVRYKSRNSCNRHEHCQGILNYSRITYIFNEDKHDFINLLYRVVHPIPPSPAIRYTTSIEVLMHSFHASRYTCLILFSNSSISIRHRSPMNDLQLPLPHATALHKTGWIRANSCFPHLPLHPLNQCRQLLFHHTWPQHRAPAIPQPPHPFS